MGVRVCAPTLPQLIPIATQGLYETIGELHAQPDLEPYSLELRGSDQAILLRDYLARVLVHFERRAKIITDFETVAFDASRLAVQARTAPVDQEKSVYCREVKAVTYHELAIREIAGGYEATFIVDI